MQTTTSVRRLRSDRDVQLVFRLLLGRSSPVIKWKNWKRHSKMLTIPMCSLANYWRWKPIFPKIAFRLVPRPRSEKKVNELINSLASLIIIKARRACASPVSQTYTHQSCTCFSLSLVRSLVASYLLFYIDSINSRSAWCPVLVLACSNERFHIDW